MRQGGGLLDLIVSDYLAYYDRYHPADPSPARLALLFVPRMIHNPCLHATALIRLATRSPRFTHGLWRSALIAKHSIDIQADMEIGPGLTLPHPLAIVLGWGVKIGTNVSILHEVTIGGVVRQPAGETQMCPRIGDDVDIYPQSMLVGPIAIGDGAVIGAGSWVDADVGAGSVHRGTASQLAQLRRTVTPDSAGEPRP